MPLALPGLEDLEIISEGPVRAEIRAVQERLGRPVHVVTLPEGVLPSSPLAEPLRREAAALARLDAPLIVRLYEFHETADRIWLVEEEVEGPSLRELSKRSLSSAALIAIFLQMARGLAHAHRLGLLHGRLHLDVARVSREGRVKMRGFGQSSPSDDQALEPLEALSPGGLSPEVTLGGASTPLSDLFSLGSLIYTLAAGEGPFGPPEAREYPQRVRTHSPTSLLRSRPDLEPRLEELISRCLEKAPGDRPASAEEVVEALERLLDRSARDVLAAELFDAPKAPSPRPRSEPPGARSRRLLRSRTFLGGAALLLGVGLAVIASALVSGENSSAPALAPWEAPPPEQALLLRVVATPWAHVFIDGEQRETTPFATPLRLRPGRHEIVLQHPAAPPERRWVEGIAGQALLLDVEMKVQRAVELAPPPGPRKESSP